MALLRMGRFLRPRTVPPRHPIVSVLALKALSATGGRLPPITPFSAAAMPAAASAAPPSSLAEAEFHRVADATLERLETVLGLAIESLQEEQGEELDLSLAMGVLTVRLASRGTYVINKQTPNRQLWWSSPVSGPRRYGWDSGSCRWKSTRDGHDMLHALQAELAKLIGRPLAL